jgi:nicotinic acid mononucleotide adenylyltransferase
MSIFFYEKNVYPPALFHNNPQFALASEKMTFGDVNFYPTDKSNIPLDTESYPSEYLNFLTSYWSSLFPVAPGPELKLKDHVVFFGGSFNPFHQGHLECLFLARKKIKDADVILLPDNNPQKMFSQEDPIKKFFELKKYYHFIYPGLMLEAKSTPSFSVVEMVKKCAPTKKISWLMGHDQLTNIESWIEYKKFLGGLHHLYLVSRNEDDRERNILIEKYEKLIPGLQIIHLGRHQYENLSSTGIRNKLTKHK